MNVTAIAGATALFGWIDVVWNVSGIEAGVVSIGDVNLPIQYILIPQSVM